MGTNNRTLISLVIVVAIAVAVGFFYLNSKIQTSQYPAQDEWLQVYISYRIHEMTDLWQRRVVVNVVIRSQDADGKPLVPKEMIIIMTSANGQEPVTQIAKDAYTQTAESTAKSILEDYGIAREHRLTVQFID